MPRWRPSRSRTSCGGASLAVAAAAALLDRTSAGSAHPALRPARRCGEDALDLSANAERLLGQGIQELRDHLGGAAATSVGHLAGALTTSRTQLAEAAERISGFPDRIRSAGQRLLDAGEPELAIEAVTEHWSRAAEQLALTALSLTDAVGALASYTDDLTGPTG